MGSKRSISMVAAILGLAFVFAGASSERSEASVGGGSVPTEVMVFEPSKDSDGLPVGGLDIPARYSRTFSLILRQQGERKTIPMECEVDIRSVPVPASAEEVERLVNGGDRESTVCTWYETKKSREAKGTQNMIPHHAYFARTGLHFYSTGGMSIVQSSQWSQSNAGALTVSWSEKQPEAYVSIMTTVSADSGKLPEVITQRVTAQRTFVGKITMRPLVDRVSVIR